jgi:hypothetical protein
MTFGIRCKDMEKLARRWRQDSQIAWSSTSPRLTGLRPAPTAGRRRETVPIPTSLVAAVGQARCLRAQGQARQSRPLALKPTEKAAAAPAPSNAAFDQIADDHVSSHELGQR